MEKDALKSKMTRKEFIRKAAIGAVAVGLSGTAIAAGPPTGPNGEILVYPTGTYPRDVDEVSYAVNGGTSPYTGYTYAGGGTILLKARGQNGETFFHFGDQITGKGTVNATKDVTIIGESISPSSTQFPNGLTPDATWPDGTLNPLDRTVVYGWSPFASLPSNMNATKLTVRNLYFAYPFKQAVAVGKTAGLEVSDCRIYDITKDVAFPGFNVSVAIEAVGLGEAQPDLTGNFIAVNNVIKRRAEPTSDCLTGYGFSDSGIAIVMTNLAVGMTGYISGNRIFNFPLVGIGITRNAGPSMIVKNKVFNCGFGGMGLGVTGCSFVAVLGAAGIALDRNTAPVTISDNEIVSGFDLTNQFLSTNGIGVVGASNATIRFNTISGKVSSGGVLLTSFEDVGSLFVASNNSLEGNNLKDLSAGGAQLYILSDCNSNVSKNNDYGSIAGANAVAGAFIQGNDNTFVNDDFWGDYSGIHGVPPRPCMWLAAGASDNTISALKKDGSPQGFDLCTQIYVDPLSTNNRIDGYEKCTARGRP